ncbi:DUF6166 domain-containing protein [Arcobacter porcinus]|uniref:Uncharacterized protein n=1 Tax=Arcobacter porcinus TaxID=1935204 RepID=A0A5C2HJH3_9BACT|nr:DUF6166 domain-containing protein [Arcobacter porcinus]OCL85391.1 hypothetical protein AAX30_01891 [Arcobacter porcinus]OCL90725.1 hypothetical protein AAX27_01536 [Aliarcobacter thereius]QEP40880.1 hypothetical protein APORC_1285 [Arcobacter porcinus]
MFNLFKIDFSNISINLFNKKVLGYKLIYKDFAIYKNNEIIDKKLNLRNHSPCGLSWGYSGSGPLQAALAILYDFTKDEVFSLNNYNDFSNDIISSLPQKNCILKFSDIQHWIDIRKLQLKG